MGYLGIESEATLTAIPEDARRGDRHDVAVDQRELVERARASRDWAMAYRHTLTAYEQRVKPLLDAHPGHRVAYFGTVPIPLAMLLGMQVSTWRTVDAYQHHHVRKDWRWTMPDEPALPVSLDAGELPGRTSQAEGDVVLRVSISYAVEARLTQAVVAAPIADLHLALDPVVRDLDSPASADEIGRRFREALDLIQDRLPRAQMIHVFASVPVGVAFRLGTSISPTMHARIQTYELDRAGPSPGYYPAFMLQRAPQAVQAATAAEAPLLAVERSVWQAELEKIQLAAKLAAGGATWLDDIGASGDLPAGRSWRALPRLGEVDAIGANVDQDTTAVEDSFRYDAGSHRWQLGDDLLLSILRRIPDPAARRRAARSFLLHESVHQDQCLTRGTAAEIGRFGKVLEEADYQADAWAFLYEYRLAVANGSPEAAKPPDFFREVIRVAIEVMMAFDDTAGAADDMQARRVSRYLIWSWQYIELERAKTFEDCVAILLEKPVIELAGLSTSVIDRRVVCSLRPEVAQHLEIAVLRRTRLYRYARGPAARLDLILRALRDHDPASLRERLRAVADAVLT